MKKAWIIDDVSSTQFKICIDIIWILTDHIDKALGNMEEESCIIESGLSFISLIFLKLAWLEPAVYRNLYTTFSKFETLNSLNSPNKILKNYKIIGCGMQCLSNILLKSPETLKDDVG